MNLARKSRKLPLIAGAAVIAGVIALFVFLWLSGRKDGGSPPVAEGERRAGLELPGATGPAPAPPANPVQKKDDAAGGPGEDLHQKVMKFHQSFPEALKSLEKDAADKLANSTEESLRDCERFLRQSPDHPKAAEVEYIYAHHLYVLSERRATAEEYAARDTKRKFDRRSFMEGYMGHVEKYARSALGKLPKEHQFRRPAMKLVADACLSSYRYPAAQQAYEEYLQAYPTAPDSDSAVSSLARATLEGGAYDRGIELIEKALKERFASDEYLSFSEFLWKLYHAKGDLAGMERSIQGVETTFPLKLLKENLNPELKERYALILDFLGFRRGYTLFARGDFARARDTFTKHVQDLVAKEAKLKDEKKALNQAALVFRGRSEANLEFLEKCAGLPPAMDLDLGPLWITPKTVTFREAKGKVVGLLIAGFDESRWGQFAVDLADQCAARPDMEFVTLYALKGSTAPEEQKDTAAAHLASRGYKGAAGFDPDAQGRKLINSFHIRYGTATFLIANRKGELVWFMEDPRPFDVEFAKKLMEAVAARP
jgi:tetratricopeptide (TPR) repeat protein